MHGIVPSPHRYDVPRSFSLRAAVILLCLVSVLALSLALQLRSPSARRVLHDPAAPASSPTPATSAPDASTCWEGFAAQFAAHTGTERTEIASAQEDVLAERIAHIHDWTKARYGRPVAIEVMIATVPDPSEPGLRAGYTKWLAGLTAGIEASAPGRMPLGHPGAFRRDREWLPWETDAGSPGGPRGAGPCREEWPGVRLFRGADADPPRVLALLLVGETPVAGVYARAMARAFEISRALQKSWRSRSPFALLEPPVLAPVGVVGPTFASSVLSLRQAIDVQRRKGFREPVDVMAAAELGLEATQVLRRATFGVADPTRYTTTAAPPGAAECALLQFARDQGASTRDGSDGVSLVEGVAFLTGRAPAPDDSDDGVDPVLARSLARCGLNAELDLTMRVAAAPEEGADDELGTGFLPQKANNAALDEIARRGIRWVGIRTGAAGLAITLASQLRERAPRARVAFLMHARSFARADVQADFAGALLITPHPLLGDRDLPSPMATAQGLDFASPRVAFPDAAAVAVFNAARALRGTPPEQLSEYTMPSADADAAGTSAEPLPFWIGSFGATGLTTLDVQPTLDCERTLLGAVEVDDPRCGGLLPGEERDGAGRTFRHDHRLEYAVHIPEGTFRTLHLALGLLALLAIAHRWHVERQHRAHSPRHAPGARSLTREALRVRWQLHATVAQFALSLASVYLFALRLFARRIEAAGAASSSFEPPMIPFVLLLATTVLCVALDLKRLASALLALRKAESAPSERFTLAGLGLALSLALAGCTAGTVLGLRALRQLGSGASQPTAHDAFYGLRSIAWQSGLSPALPLLLALLVAFSWQRGRMTRLALLSRSALARGEALPVSTSAPIAAILCPAPGTATAAVLVSDEHRLNASMSSPWSGVLPGASALVMALALFGFVARGPSTLEAGATGVLLLASLGLCAGLIGADWIALLRHERGLRRLVDGILSSRFGEALQAPGGPVRSLAHIDFAREELAFAVCAEAQERLEGSGPEGSPGRSSTPGEALHRRVVAGAIEVSGVLHGLARGSRGTSNAVATEAWVREAESFVAAVVCLLVRRHCQVFAKLQSSAVACTCVLLSATVVYPFGWASTRASELALLSLALFLLAQCAAELLRSRFGASARAVWQEPLGALSVKWASLSVLLLFCARAFLDGPEWHAFFTPLLALTR